MIESLDGFVGYIKKNRYYLDTENNHAYYVKDQDIHCLKCKGDRRHTIRTIYSPIDSKKIQQSEQIKPTSILSAGSNIPEIKISAESLCPSMFELKCIQCDSFITVLICNFNGNPEILSIPSSIIDVGTPNTKLEVAFYLEQAYKCQMSGANSAAVTMYRAALEMLLFCEGYTNGMLGTKIAELKKQITDGTAPLWAKNSDPEIISLINSLGNFSIHPNDGDIEKQKTFGRELLGSIKILFNKLLDLVYESRLRDDAHKKLLADAEKKLGNLSSP